MERRRWARWAGVPAAGAREARAGQQVSIDRHNLGDLAESPTRGGGARVLRARSSSWPSTCAPPPAASWPLAPSAQPASTSQHPSVHEFAAVIAARPVAEELGRLGPHPPVSDATPAWRRPQRRRAAPAVDTQEGPVLCKQDAAAPTSARAESAKALRAASMSTGTHAARPAAARLRRAAARRLLPAARVGGGQAPARLRSAASAGSPHTAPRRRARTPRLSRRHVAGGGGGGLRQDNRWGRYLSEFFIERRLRRSRRRRRATTAWPRRGTRVRAQFSGAIPAAFSTPPSRPLGPPPPRREALLRPANGAPPALLHALSASTVSEDDAGRPVLRDPACWYGPPEADLACDLAVDDARGRLGAEFHDAYHSAWAFKEQAGAAARRDVYVLYHRLARHAAQHGDDAAGGVDAERTREIAERVATEGLLFEGRAGGGRGFM